MAYKLLKTPKGYFETFCDYWDGDLTEVMDEIFETAKQCKNRKEAEKYFDNIDSKLKNLQDEIGEFRCDLLSLISNQ